MNCKAIGVTLAVIFVGVIALRIDSGRNDWILFSTFVALVAYTYYTYELLETTKEAKEMEFFPLLVVKEAPFFARARIDASDVHRKILIENRGTGLALEVKVRPMKCWYTEIRDSNPLPFIDTKEIGTIVPNTIYSSEDNNGRAPLEITCKDCLGNNYEYIYRMENSVTPVLEHVFRNGKLILTVKSDISDSLQRRGG